MLNPRQCFYHKNPAFIQRNSPALCDLHPLQLVLRLANLSPEKIFFTNGVKEKKDQENDQGEASYLVTSWVLESVQIALPSRGTRPENGAWR